MIDKIIYIKVWGFCSRYKFIWRPEGIGFGAAIIPKVAVVLALLSLNAGADGYAVFNGVTDELIFWTVIILLALNTLYILRFSGFKNHDRTKEEVERALRESPIKWKLLLTLYWAIILIFIYIACRVI